MDKPIRQGAETARTTQPRIAVDTAMMPVEKKSSAIDPDRKYELEEELKAEFEKNDNYSLEQNAGNVSPSIENLSFLNPVQGLVSKAAASGSNPSSRAEQGPGPSDPQMQHGR